MSHEGTKFQDETTNPNYWRGSNLSILEYEQHYFVVLISVYSYLFISNVVLFCLVAF